MLPSVLIGVCLGVAVIAAWYGWFARFNRQRGQRVLRWLRGAIADYGQISSVAWMGPAHFCARLSLSGHAFRQPFLDVQLAPRQTPLHWALWCARRRQETLTFQANLSCPPGESLEISRLRWSTLTRRRVPVPGVYPTCTVATLFISTQPEWTPQLSGRINGVVATRDFEFLLVSFRTGAPHFSATFSLQETLRHPCRELAIFESLRELAQGSPTSRM